MKGMTSNLSRRILEYIAVTVFLISFESTEIHAQSPTPGNNIKALNQKYYLELFTTPKHEGFSGRSSFEDLSDYDELDEITVYSDGCAAGCLFSSFNPDCQRSIQSVGDLLMAEKNTTELIALARRLRDHPVLHPKVWYSALTIVTLGRKDLRGLWKPAPVDVIPDTFINRKAIEKAQNQRSAEECVLLDEKFGEDNLIENRLWYFREDIRVNSNHWFWHLSYPVRPANGTPHADRRGELFFFFHHNMVQRYNAERLANGLPRAANFRVERGFAIDEGYYPHLNDSLASTYQWDSRAPFSKLPESILNLNTKIRTTFDDILLWRDRILNSIDQGTFTFSNWTEPIMSRNGSDILGDLTEASNYTINSRYYGNFHNSMHNMMGAVNDPNMTRLGVIADGTVAMRDPVFYRWHAYVDNISDRYKRTLKPYRVYGGDFPLIWDGVQVSMLRILPNSRPSTGTLETFWSVRTLSLTRRLDISEDKRPPIKICAKHLNHEDFGYYFVINLDQEQHSSPKNATVRIYMAPRFSEFEKRFTMDEQRNWFFVMDIFKTTLKPGINVILRNSNESSVTIPWEQSLKHLEGYKDPPRPWCGCGWPDHLLLPKGNASGMVFDIFAMVTNGDDDKVVQDEPEVATEGHDTCRSAPPLCGVLGKKYPDAKPMGYPFDREPYKVIEAFGTESFIRPVRDLDEYVEWVPNMATTKITIVHDDRIRQ